MGSLTFYFTRGQALKNNSWDGDGSIGKNTCWATMKTRIWILPPTWQVACDLPCLSLQNWERPRVVGELKGLAVCQSSQKTMSCRFRGTLFQGNNVGSDSRHLLSPDPLTHVHTYARARVHTYTHKWKKQLLLYHKCGWIYFFFHITVSQGQLFFSINKSVTILLH